MNTFKNLKNKILSFDWSPKYERKRRDASPDGSILATVRNTASMRKEDTIKHAAEKMLSLQTRRVFLIDSVGRIEGVVTCKDIMNFLGGGEHYNLIKEKHQGNLTAAMNEPVREIMTQRVTALKSSNSLKDALAHLKKTGLGGVPVERNDVLIGMITEKRIVNLMSKSLTGQLVKDHMAKEIIFGTPGETVLDISKTMARNSFRRIPILQERHLVGIVTSKDLVFEFARQFSRDFLNTQISRLMSKPKTIDLNATLQDAAQLMTQHNISGLPVMEGEKCVGMITAKDLIKAVQV
ncbi:MAG: CBS domain-containing protein [Candidatus Undinarchaeales archaeon]|jgi:CBS domain-containing protein|nr:CBS domain-containing protein [Candidatus Undinarchaeales archaeon]